MMATSDVAHTVKTLRSALGHFAQVYQSTDTGDLSFVDHFWTEPGNGWGKKTA